MHTYIHTYIRTCVYVCMYVYVCVLVQCMEVCVHTYTYTHVPSWSSRTWVIYTTLTLAKNKSNCIAYKSGIKDRHAIVPSLVKLQVAALKFQQSTFKEKERLTDWQTEWKTDRRTDELTSKCGRTSAYVYAFIHAHKNYVAIIQWIRYVHESFAWWERMLHVHASIPCTL
jgi:hypothetical protein